MAGLETEEAKGPMPTLPIPRVYYGSLLRICFPPGPGARRYVLSHRHYRFRLCPKPS